jgi:hypothetical protein
MEEREAQGDVTVLPPEGDAGLLKMRARLGEFAQGGSQYCGAYECGALSWNPTWPSWRMLTSCVISSTNVSD